MAGAKLSPRQKMINMMYLVLTAMLALNISKDILDALTRLNESLATSAQTVENKNELIYDSFEDAMEDNPTRTKEWRDKAMIVKKESEELFSKIEETKKNMIMESGGYDSDKPNQPKKMDNREGPANYMINKKNGEKLRKAIEDYRALLTSDKIVGDNKRLVNEIEKIFDTSPQTVDKTKVSWESANFEHFPLIATLTTLTEYQAKVRTVESDVISQLSQNIEAGTLKFDAVEPAVIPSSTYVTEGGEYTAKVFLSAFDKSQEPTIMVNGTPLPKEQIQNGVGFVKIPATGVGEKTWGGSIEIQQIGDDKPKTYKIPEQSFTVAPRSLVISPTKMNVLYRSVDNPIDIGVPGVPASNIKASGPGLRQTGPGNYTVDVTNYKGKTLKISVDVEKEVMGADGTKKMVTENAGQKEFRVKGLPPAVGMVYKKTEGTLSKNALKRATVTAEFEDFVFDLKLRVKSFEIAIPGFPPETVRGDQMNAAVRQRLDQLPPNSTISIRDIKAVTANKGMRINRVGSISIDVN